MEEREIMTKDVNEVEKEVDNSIDNEQGFAFSYNLTMVSAMLQ